VDHAEAHGKTAQTEAVKGGSSDAGSRAAAGLEASLVALPYLRTSADWILALKA
jgi:hypothetical protein